MKIKRISLIVCLFVCRWALAGTDNPSGSTITSGFNASMPGPYSNAGTMLLNGIVSATNFDAITNTGTIFSVSKGITSSADGVLINNQGIVRSTGGHQNYPIYSLGNNATIVNSGEIIGTGSGDFRAIHSTGNFASITNNVTGIIRTIYLGSGSNGMGIYTLGALVAIVNEGLIETSGTTGIGIYTVGLGSTVLSRGSIVTSGDVGVGMAAYGDNMTINNFGSITTAGTNAWGIYNQVGFGDGLNLTNTGSIFTSGLNSHGVYLATTGNSVVNSGSISAVLGDGIRNAATGSIVSIINTGDISPGTAYFGINNLGAITSLSNKQNTLTYSGNLPANYNVIIASPGNYGKLAATGAGVTATTFGIYAGSTVRNGTYASVLTGLTSSNLSGTSGTFGSGSWILNNSSGDIWDLILSGFIDPIVLTGPSVANTNQSLVNTASVLQGTYTLQNSVIANSFSYDCTFFGDNNVCVSAGGRNTAVAAANGLNNNSALLIAAYRPHPNYRIGAYADQNLSVSNPGGTVNLGNNTPVIGLFGAWNQCLNGTGAEVKVSAAYGQKSTTIARSVVGSGEGASEAGSGSSNLISQGAQVSAKYGFGIADDLIVSPYVGVRFTQNNMAGYTEGTSATVIAPLTYSALNTNSTTALAGVGANYRVIPTVTTFASAGVETDTNTANGTFSATNAAIGTLTPVNFNANPVKTRPTATAGAYYDIEKNQRLGITGIYRQEAYQAVSTTTVMATYTIGL